MFTWCVFLHFKVIYHKLMHSKLVRLVMVNTVNPERMVVILVKLGMCVEQIGRHRQTENRQTGRKTDRQADTDRQKTGR